MAEPMSLFDWGIYKTDKKLADMKTASSMFTAQFFSSSAEYDWDANRISFEFCSTEREPMPSASKI
jgi:hypothetical protein